MVLPFLPPTHPGRQRPEVRPGGGAPQATVAQLCRPLGFHGPGSWGLRQHIIDTDVSKEQTGEWPGPAGCGWEAHLDASAIWRLWGSCHWGPLRPGQWPALWTQEGPPAGRPPNLGPTVMPGPESPPCRARDSRAAAGAEAQPAMGGQSWVTGHRCVPAESLSLFCPQGSG